MRKTLLLILFSTFSIVLFAQVSISQADRIVERYVEKEITDYYWLYSNENIVADKNGVTTVHTWNKASVSTNHSCFVYFVDEHPYANWGHPCRYLFVDKQNGEIYETKAKTPPENMGTWKMITPFPEIPEGAKFDFSKSNRSLRSGINTQNCYAVIISGGASVYANWERYWNDCSAIYSALIHVYGYSKDHIYVLISDGTNPANDRRLNSGGYDSSPLDLDGDGLPDTQYAATKNDIATVFNRLSTILTSDDHLFIFTTDHGGLTSSGQATLELWQETMTASEFASEVNKVSPGHTSVVMEQCFSGGFVPYLTKQGRTVATACSGTEESWAMPPYFTYNEFVYHWTAAVVGYTPSGNPVDADYNSDGYVSVKEAFDYAKARDNRDETPQYNSTGPYLGDYLTLYGTEACTTIGITNQVINTNTGIEGCTIYVQNVTVTGNAALGIDTSGEVTINGEFEVRLGSELHIK